MPVVNDTVRIVDVWESAEHLEEFERDRLMPAFHEHHAHNRVTYSSMRCCADAAGNVYASGEVSNNVVELPAGCSSGACQLTLPFAGLSNPFGSPSTRTATCSSPIRGTIACRAAERLHVGELPAGAPVRIPTNQDEAVSSVSVDAAGDVFTSADVDQVVIELPSGCSSTSCRVVLPANFNGLASAQATPPATCTGPTKATTACSRPLMAARRAAASSCFRSRT